ncbi:isochorismate synthase [Microcella sp.]|uniref:isochorismate synthase n=1 Tax=Microcella sp. TaxID=1913979 RepID=UPI00256643ED|nr:chorismate-binding protein [Microcella sp.]
MRAVTATAHPHEVLLELADLRDPLVALRRDDGIIGIGELLRLEFSGPDRLTEAAEAWRGISAAADVKDGVGLAGCGLVAFGTFAFADSSTAASVLVVPQLIVGRRDGVSWVTRITVQGDDTVTEPPNAAPIGERPRATLAAASLSREGFTAVVGSAVQAIRDGRVEKVVIARDAVASIPPDADRRALLSELADRYPDCLTFAVDGLIGASPETLVSVHAHEASARVLAGSTARGAGSADDAAAAATLATSQKDLDEHAFAVRSVLDALQPHVRAITASELPFTLKLPNLWHLATDIEMQLGDGASALDLVAALHPTAAVAGSPRDAALELIGELEPFDRGRYAGPVGWIDQDGDGEWVIALRCARIDDDGALTAYAGAGIVIDSDPDSELAETRMKFRPIADALR